MKFPRLSLHIFSLIFFLSSTTLSFAAQDKISLRLVLKKGAVNNTMVLMDQKIVQVIQEKQYDIAQTIGMGYKMEIEDVDPAGIAKVKVTYHTIVFKQNGPAGLIEYDSTKPPAVVNPMAKSYALLVGESFIIYIDQLGRVSRVSGIDAMLKRMTDKLGVSSGPQRDEMEKNLKKNINDAVLKETMEKMMAVYPAQPIGVGDSWSKTTTLSKIFPMVTENTWTLKSRNDGTAYVDVVSKVKPNPDAAPIKMGNLDLRYSLGGEQNGTLEFNESTGWVTRGKLIQALSGEIVVSGDPSVPEGASWPISMDSVVTIE